MKILLISLIVLACSELLNAQNISDMELFSPNSNVSLNLRDGNYTLSVLTFYGDQIFSDEYQAGSYSMLSDTLVLVSSNNKISKLLKETFEIYNPIDVDSTNFGQKFLAWSIYYENGQVKQSGGWTSNHQKDGVWAYFDSTGKVINRKIFGKGKLVNDDFKPDW